MLIGSCFITLVLSLSLFPYPTHNHSLIQRARESCTLFSMYFYYCQRKIFLYPYSASLKEKHLASFNFQAFYFNLEILSIFQPNICVCVIINHYISKA